MVNYSGYEIDHVIEIFTKILEGFISMCRTAGSIAWRYASPYMASVKYLTTGELLLLSD